MLIGEAPGEKEDSTGWPFVGPAGRLLNEALKLSGIISTDQERNSIIYITNTVLCMPKFSGKIVEPSLDEIKNCNERLLREIYIVDPKLIVLLGSVSHKLLKGKKILGELGKVEVPGQLDLVLEYLAIPTYHPSYALRKGGIQSSEGQLIVKHLKLAKRIVDLSLSLYQFHQHG
jgi:DNA polymerase